MAKKATSKAGGGAKAAKKSSVKPRQAVARVSSPRGGARRDDGFNAGDAFIKLLQSPLVAELVAVAATAALASLAENGFTSGGDATRKARREGGEGGRQGCRGRGRAPAQQRDR